jgi:hypothetical protein
VPVLYKGDQRRLVDSQAELEAALRDGWYQGPTDEGVVIDRPEGTVSVDPKLLPYVRADHAPATAAARLEAGTEAQREINYDNPVGAALLGAASVATLSASDWIARGAGVPVNEISAYNPRARLAGEIVGTVATALSPLGKGGIAKVLAKTPGGVLAKAGLRGETALARVGYAAGEGGIWGVAQASSAMAIREPGVVAESTLAELGQGALLGAALGGVFGGLGEGVRVAKSAHAARKAAAAADGPFDLKSGPAREGIDSLTTAWKEIDDSIDHAAANLTRNADEARTAMNTEWSGRLKQQVDEIYTNAVQPRKYYADELADQIRVGREGLTAAPSREAAVQLAEQVNAVAVQLGKKPPVSAARLRTLSELGEVRGLQGKIDFVAKAADDMLAKHTAGTLDEPAEVLFQKYRATGDDVHALEFLHHVRGSKEPGVAEWVDEALFKLKADADAIEESVVALTPKAFDKTAGRRILGLRDGEKVSPATFERLFSLPPQRLLAKATEIGDYYKAAQEAVVGNALAEERIAAAIVAQRQALTKLVPTEASALLNPTAMAAVLGLSAVPELNGPADEFLKAAVVAKLLGGLKGLRLAGKKTYAKRIAGAIGRRMMAGSFAYTAAGSALVRGLPGPAKGAVIGGAASGGFETASALERWFGRFSSKSVARGTDDLAYREQVTAAVKSEIAAKSRVTDAAARLAKGKPNRYSTGPAVGQVLGILAGEPEKSGKTDHEKFKAIQANLSRFITAPDAVMQNVYETLKPVQQLSEEIADQAEVTLMAQLEQLYEAMPKDPGSMDRLGLSLWQPTDRELFEFSMTAMGVVAPFDVVDMIADGTAPPQAAQALARANPEIFRLAQEAIVERVDDIRENATQAQLISLGLAFQLALEPTAAARYVKFVQDMHAEQSAPAPTDGGGGSGDPSSDAEYSEAQSLLR